MALVALHDRETHVRDDEQLGSRARQVVDVVAGLLASRDPEGLHVDLPEVGVAGALLQGQDKLVLSIQVEYGADSSVPSN